MEHFDYLTYKKNKHKKQNSVSIKSEGNLTSKICIATFAVIFVLVISFIGSKSSKIDVEYGRLGSNETEVSSDEEESYPHEKFTIDKRLFLIQQEEKGPSESKVIAKNEQSEVISADEFKMIKNNSEEVAQGAERTHFAVPKDNTENVDNTETKPVMKPKIPIKPAVKQAGALDISITPSKVLVGKYSTQEEAKAMQIKLSGAISDTAPFIKKIANIYTVQVGSFDNFDMAKTVAGNLKIKGYDVWILQ
ncbi:MAG: SPOR domain-containing protein [Candidatus Gastranaerophilales bacterium]|nr:SPOR domain-containing protein [Candidatus Gastranaerophilales bacterium]